MVSWLLSSTAWSCKRFWYIILAEILCCLNSLKSGGRSKNNNFLNFTSLLMIESWSCSESLWILLYILFTSSWEEKGASYLKRFPFSVQRAITLFLVACMRLYKPLCWSVCLLVNPSVAVSSEHATYGHWPCVDPITPTTLPPK